MKKFSQLLCMLVGVSLVFACTTYKGKFLLINNTNEIIRHASVSVCGQKLEFYDVKPSSSDVGNYKVKSDSSYVVELEFQSGKKLNKEIGYITNGIDYSDIITVKERDIEISKNKN